MGVVQEPATLGLAAVLDELKGFAGMRVGSGAGGAEVVERAKDVVAIARGIGEAEELGIDDFSGAEAAEKRSLEQVFFATLTGGGDFRSGSDRTFVFEKTFEHTDRAVKRRDLALGGFAVPTAVLKLICDETAREALGGMSEVGSRGKRAAIDAGFDFALEEGLRAELGVPAKTSLQALDGSFDGGVGGVDAGGAQELHGEEGGQPVWSVGAVPGTVGTLARENFGGYAFVRDAGTLQGEGGRGDVREIAHGLPTNGGIGIEEPGKGIHGENITVSG